MWDIIRDEKSTRITLKHSLKVALAAVMGFNSKWMFSNHVEQPEDRSPLKVTTRVVDFTAPERGMDRQGRRMRVEIGVFIERMFFLKMAEEADYLHRTFLPFYHNRMTQVDH